MTNLLLYGFYCNRCNLSEWNIWRTHCSTYYERKLLKRKEVRLEQTHYMVWHNLPSIERPTDSGIYTLHLQNISVLMRTFRETFHGGTSGHMIGNTSGCVGETGRLNLGVTTKKLVVYSSTERKSPVEHTFYTKKFVILGSVETLYKCDTFRKTLLYVSFDTPAQRKKERVAPVH